MKIVRLRSKNRSAQKGFSLVELLVALAILALIPAIVVVNVLPARDKAAVDTTRIEIRNLEATLDQYRLDMMNYPTTQQGLEALVSVPADARNAANYRPGGYLRGGVPNDPWGNPYVDKQPAERAPYEIRPLGADGQEGGTGTAADLVSGQN